jgi:hypothetical protein
MSWAGQREFDEFAARRSDETPTSARTSSVGSMPSRQLAEKNFLAPLQFSPAFSALENANNLAKGFRNGNSRLE